MVRLFVSLMAWGPAFSLECLQHCPNLKCILFYLICSSTVIISRPFGSTDSSSPAKLGDSVRIWLLSAHRWAKGGPWKGQVVLGEAFSYDSAGQEWASLYETIKQNNVITVKGGFQSQLRLPISKRLIPLHFQLKRAAAFKRRQEKGAMVERKGVGYTLTNESRQEGDIGQQMIPMYSGCVAFVNKQSWRRGWHNGTVSLFQIRWYCAIGIPWTEGTGISKRKGIHYMWRPEQ